MRRLPRLPPGYAPRPPPHRISLRRLPQTPLPAVRHYAKRTTRTTLPTALPQGLLSPSPLPPLPTPPATPRYPPLLSLVSSTISTLPPRTVLLTRVGSFYELYFSHATQYAPLLHLKLTRKILANGEEVAFAGFPVSQLQRFLKMLVGEGGLGVNVAIAEETGETEKGREVRRVVRVVTPGTWVEEEGAGERVLAAVVERGDAAVVAWAVVATGESWVLECAAEEVPGELVRLGVKEVVVEEEGVAGRLLAEGVGRVEVLEGGREGGLKERGMGLLRGYVKSRMPEDEVVLLDPVERDVAGTVRLDADTLRGLEVVETMREGSKKGSLLGFMDETVTEGGRRLLKDWLMNPITHIPTIEHRLDCVQAFNEDPALREEVIGLLKRCCDANRLIQRFSMGRGQADDMVSIARTIEVAETLRVRLSDDANPPAIRKLVENITIPVKVAKSIRKAIDEEGVMQQQRALEDEAQELAEVAAVVQGKEKKKPLKTTRMLKEEHKERFEAWIMLPNASPLLKKLHAKLAELEHERVVLEEKLRLEYDCPSLSLRWTPSLGHIVHAKAIHAANLKAAHSPISSSRSTTCFHLPAWTALGASQDTTRLSIRTAESALFTTLRKSLIKSLPLIRPLSHLLSTLDVLTTFSTLSQLHNLTRPTFTTAPTSTLTSAIHLPVAAALHQQALPFTPNSLLLPAPPHPRTHILTGPNMSGKSTYLRLLGHAHILAQTGSFVPAAHAHLGLVDAVFARLTTADSIVAGESSFFTEMRQVASVLRAATERSLVLMDEIGRGTTPEDGEAIAGAVVRWMVQRKVRCVFATHFWGLVGEEGTEGWCEGVGEDGAGGWWFERALRRGVCKDSAAMRVAGLAGVGEEVVGEAKRRRGALMRFREEAEGRRGVDEERG